MPANYRTTQTRRCLQINMRYNIAEFVVIRVVMQMARIWVHALIERAPIPIAADRGVVEVYFAVLESRHESQGKHHLSNHKPSQKKHRTTLMCSHDEMQDFCDSDAGQQLSEGYLLYTLGVLRQVRRTGPANKSQFVVCVET